MIERHRFTSIVVYLDDSLVIGHTKAECQAAFEFLLQLLQDSGFSISWRKDVYPTQKLVFLGVELDTIQQCMALPLAKLVELQALVEGFKARKGASRRQLQHLAGKLNWRCRIAYGGRTFLHRIPDTINHLAQPSIK